MNEGVSTSDLQSILKRVEEQLAKAGELPAAAEEAVGQLLNVVEALNSDKKSLALRQNLWVESDINLTTGPQFRLDRGDPPLAPLPSHQPSIDGAKG